MKDQVAERIKAFRKHIGLSVSELSDLLDKGTPAIYAIEQGRVFPQLDDLAILQSQHGLNLNWIISGKGNMVLDELANPVDSDGIKALVSQLRSDPQNDALAKKIDTQLNLMQKDVDKLEQVIALLSRDKRSK
ncbi:MAG: hypothetical protein AAGJ93_00845 [Bacteroidota bacterium]